MTPQEMEQVLLYLVDKLDPQSREEVGEILGGEVPDMGQDAMNKGGRAWERLPKRLKRRAALSAKKSDDAPRMGQDGKPAETHEERFKRMFPHADRLKVSY